MKSLLVPIMKGISKELDLPKSFRNDIEIDFACVSEMKAIWVWSLRPCGTRLSLCHLGGSADSVEHDIHEGVSTFFKADGFKNTITPLKPNEALALVNEPILDIVGSTSYQALITFDKVIDRGLELRLWHVFTGPNKQMLNNVHNAREYFLCNKLPTMVQFLDRVIAQVN